MAEQSGGGSSKGAERTMWLTLVAMTLSASMILVDQTAVPLASSDAINDLHGGADEGQWLLTANILPLAAFMVFGGKLGDLLGLRRVFLAGAGIFLVATVMAGLAQDMTWMLSARVVQGIGAACMMPTSVAIVAAVAPEERRGMALGVLAGGSAFFAALGPVLGGLLTSIDWRLVFLVNVPLAAAAIVLTLGACPALPAVVKGRVRDLDFAGMTTLALGAALLLFGLSQVGSVGFDSPEVWGSVLIAAASFAAFVVIELRVEDPLIDFRLFRHDNFLASNISQFLSGAVELGLGFLLPFALLLVIGVGPVTAGLALIPATVPIIIAGPLAGRAFDRVGGRVPLVVGFLVLAASGAALAVGIGDQSAVALIPGLALQGIGLGIVLTVNDPVGLNAVPEKDRGRAAGMINTSEQLGGALGISILLAVELDWYRHQLVERLHDRGINPTDDQVSQIKDFILKADQEGYANVKEGRVVHAISDDLILAHVDGFRLAFIVSGSIALLGAAVCWSLVRKQDHVTLGGRFRRSRWLVWSTKRGQSAEDSAPSPHNSPNPQDG